MEKEVTREYISQMTPTSIKATSRMSLKIKDNFYTIEASEERTLTGDVLAMNMDDEWKCLFNSVNDVVDNQMVEIYDTFKEKR